MDGNSGEMIAKANRLVQAKMPLSRVEHRIVGMLIFQLDRDDEERDSGSEKAVEIVSHKGKLEEDRPVQVTGVVRNTSERRHGHVGVCFFNEAGSQVGDTTA